MTDVRTQRDISWFDHAASSEAAAAIHPACASVRWIGELVMARPWVSLESLLQGSDAAIAALTWSDLSEALAAHPRIGDQAQGDDDESSWSRQEQSATADLQAQTRDELRAANIEYENHFGFVFLICATGKSTEQMLGQLRSRLGNSERQEHEVVRGELREIVRLRLARIFA